MDQGAGARKSRQATKSRGVSVSPSKVTLRQESSGTMSPVFIKEPDNTTNAYQLHQVKKNLLNRPLSSVNRKGRELGRNKVFLNKKSLPKAVDGGIATPILS